MTEQCPHDSVLERLLDDQLTHTEERALDDHVAGCAPCQSRLERLAGEDFAAPVVSSCDEPDRERTRHATAGGSPAQFGRYHVRRVLGSGGFATVYLGYDPQLDRPVAIKAFRSEAMLSQEQRESRLQEARRLARLRHGGIVTVHDVGVRDGQVYFVSDCLHGPTLGEWLKTNRIDWPDAVSIAAAVADALAHAHARLIIHRDVKPANIILTEWNTPVLVDLGVALDEASAGGVELGIVSGTLEYMSPEQVTGMAHRIDGRTDIYSLGVVLYEMLCGRPPFGAQSRRELMRQVRDDDPQPPRQLAPSIPLELEFVCLKALAKRQNCRFTTAADFALDLRNTLPHTVKAATPATFRRPAPFEQEAAPGDSWIHGPFDGD